MFHFSVNCSGYCSLSKLQLHIHSVYKYIHGRINTSTPLHWCVSILYMADAFSRMVNWLWTCAGGWEQLSTRDSGTQVLWYTSALAHWCIGTLVHWHTNGGILVQHLQAHHFSLNSFTLETVADTVLGNLTLHCFAVHLYS